MDNQVKNAQWVTIHGGQGSRFTEFTYRLNVPGGWVIRHLIYDDNSASETSVFVPNPNETK